MPSVNDRSTWVGASTDYLLSLRAVGRSPGTVRLHRYYLSCLASQHARPWHITTTHLHRFMAVDHWKPETRKSARGVVRSFYRWGHGEGLIDHDPSARLHSVRVPGGCARPAPEAVLRTALAGADSRVRLMLMLAAYGGLRCAEISRVHSRDLIGDELRVLGKGGKTRVVPILVPELHGRLALVDGWAFPNGRGAHVTPGHVTKLLSSALPGDWTGHTLRHRMATQAYAGTRDLLAVGAVLGHSRPETTQRYVRLPNDALRAAVAAAAPAA